MSRRYPEPIVGAFIVNTKGELLLIKTHKWNNKYCVVGGHLEMDETMREGLIREVREETALIATGNIKFLVAWDYISDGEYWKKKHMLFLNHLVYVEDGPLILNEESEDYIWVTPKQSLLLDLESYTRKTIEQYIIPLGDV